MLLVLEMIYSFQDERQVLGYLDYGTHFEKPGLLGADGVHLSEQGRSIFSYWLAQLVKRALN